MGLGRWLGRKGGKAYSSSTRRAVAPVSGSNGPGGLGFRLLMGLANFQCPSRPDRAVSTSLDARPASLSGRLPGVLKNQAGWAPVPNRGSASWLFGHRTYDIRHPATPDYHLRGWWTAFQGNLAMEAEVRGPCPGCALWQSPGSDEALHHQAPLLTTGMDVVVRGLSFPWAPGSSLGYRPRHRPSAWPLVIGDGGPLGEIAQRPPGKESWD